MNRVPSNRTNALGATKNGYQKCRHVASAANFRKDSQPTEVKMVERHGFTNEPQGPTGISEAPRLQVSNLVAHDP